MLAERYGSVNQVLGGQLNNLTGDARNINILDAGNGLELEDTIHEKLIVANVPGDGNCLPSCLALGLVGDLARQQDIRDLIGDSIRTVRPDIIQLNANVGNLANEADLELQQEEARVTSLTNGQWLGTPHIVAIASALGLSVTVLNASGESLQAIRIQPDDVNQSALTPLLLLRVNNNHYKLVTGVKEHPKATVRIFIQMRRDDMSISRHRSMSPQCDTFHRTPLHHQVAVTSLLFQIQKLQVR